MLRFLIHKHGEAESATFADSSRVDTDFSLTQIHDALDNCQSQTNSFAVHINSFLQFAEASEEFWKILNSDARASVFYMDNKDLCLSFVTGFDFNMSSRGKLKGIFDQVDEHLLKTTLISN